MDLQKAELMAFMLIEKVLVDEHCVTGYEFDWTRKKNAYGTCNYSRKKIMLSKHLVPVMSEEDVRDTILHEIAHAISYENHGERGHGRTWKWIAREIGCAGKRTGDKGMVEAKWAVVALNNGSYAKYSECNRRLKNITNRYITGKKALTAGKLRHVPMEMWKKYQAGVINASQLTNHAVL